MFSETFVSEDYVNNTRTYKYKFLFFTWTKTYKLIINYRNTLELRKADSDEFAVWKIQKKVCYEDRGRSNDIWVEDVLSTNTFCYFKGSLADCKIIIDCKDYLTD